METLNITPERFQQALAWINGQPSTLGEKEVLEMLRSLTAAYQENCRRLRPGPVPRFRNLRLAPHPLSLTALMAEAKAQSAAPESSPENENPYLKELLADDAPKASQEAANVPGEPSVTLQEPLTPEQEVMAQVAEESRLDSVLLINSIAHVGAAAGYPVTQSRAQIILYCLYGTSLASTGERLAIEHPQMWKYGPVFPRAYKRGNIEDLTICAESYHELMATQPDLLTRLSTKTQSMMATSMADLNAVHKGAKSPYGKMVAKFPDKWGTQIPDEDIAAFFRSRMAG